MANRKFRENPAIQRFPTTAREWASHINELSKFVVEQKDLAYWIGSPGSNVWRSDGAGVYPADNPTADLTIEFFSVDGAVFALRTLRGTLTTSNGNISVTNVTATGSTTSYVLYGNASGSVRADVSVVLPTGKTMEGSLTWNSVDMSVAGATPTTITGGGGGGGGGGGAK